MREKQEIENLIRQIDRDSSMQNKQILIVKILRLILKLL